MAEGSIDALTDETAELLERGIFRLYRQMRQQPALQDMSPQDPVLLKQIARHPGIGVVELAVMERLRAPTITAHINRMVDAGLVQRTNDPRDRRRVGLSITVKGKHAIRLATDVRHVFLARRLAALSQDEQALLQAAAPLLLKLGDDDAAVENLDDRTDTEQALAGPT